MSGINQSEPSLAHYSPSLQQAARALWGDDFWGRHAPRPVKPEPPRKR